MLKQGHTIRAVPGSYIVLLDPIPGITEGGLHLPKGVKQQDGEINQVAEIVAVGGAYMNAKGESVSAPFAQGASVLVNPQAMLPLQHKSARLYVISFQQVIAGFVHEDQVDAALAEAPESIYTIGDI